MHHTLATFTGYMTSVAVWVTANKALWNWLHRICVGWRLFRWRPRSIENSVKSLKSFNCMWSRAIGRRPFDWPSICHKFCRPSIFSTLVGWPSPTNSWRHTNHIFWLASRPKLSNCWRAWPSARCRRIDFWMPAITCGWDHDNFSLLIEENIPKRPFRSMCLRNTNRCTDCQPYITPTTPFIAILPNRSLVIRHWRYSTPVVMSLIKLALAEVCRPLESVCCKYHLYLCVIHFYGPNNIDVSTFHSAIMYTLSKQAKVLQANKLHLQVSSRLQTLKVPQGMQEQVDVRLIIYIQNP